ncbi:UvrD-helicase domain-containing protein [Anoxybacillus flavithermus]|uniref:UvrD-helicase domain-containing protein n=1 Tax=Anoxybacillus flavithermus TaxID=33934 RepID=UPI0018689E38|nr:ATP-dependent helicase [Anoxybacillus flavithermus]MBE2916486.1 ATP-dependent helicase [Anoxybacillus flavithermus]
MSMVEYKLTPTQEEIVNFKGSELLIRGIAGSGKTTVLLRKARKIIESESDTTVALFTFNRTLAKYAQELAETLNSDRIKVYTFHQWAGIVLEKMDLKRPVLTSKMQDDFFVQAVANMRARSNHRYFKDNSYISFLKEEVSWIKGKGLVQLEQYEKADRTGRGSKVRVTKSDRKRIFDLFQEYQSILDAKGKMDFDDFAVTIYQNIDLFPESLRIDHVLIDEAQDLDQMQLQVLRHAAKKSIIIAADKGQKIYKTSFSWSEIGINVRGGRTKVLKNSFRSTKQIISLAHSLQKHDSLYKSKDEDFINPEIPEHEGPLPVVVNLKDKYTHDVTVINFIKELQTKDPSLTIGVLARVWRPLYRLKYALERHEINFEMIQRDEGKVTTPGVKLTTFHSAKGLEFDVAMIIDLNNDTIPLPSEEAENDDETEYMDIERRLLYVSMTRAKLILYMFYYGKPSVFLDEMDSALYEVIEM